MVKVLFVCLGNICRSPTAEIVFRSLVEKAGLADSVQIDSAGTGDWNIGRPPDQRAQKAAATRGYDLSALRARKVSAADFSKFDLVIAMDRSNLVALSQICPPDKEGRLHLYLDFTPGLEGQDIPDPYYGRREGFERMLDLIETGAAHILEQKIRLSA
jgi:protein-tyrosine phosphatase